MRSSNKEVNQTDKKVEDTDNTKGGDIHQDDYSNVISDTEKSKADFSEVSEQHVETACLSSSGETEQPTAMNTKDSVKEENDLSMDINEDAKDAELNEEEKQTLQSLNEYLNDDILDEIDKILYMEDFCAMGDVGNKNIYSADKQIGEVDSVLVDKVEVDQKDKKLVKVDINEIRETAFQKPEESSIEKEKRMPALLKKIQKEDEKAKFGQEKELKHDNIADKKTKSTNIDMPTVESEKTKEEQDYNLSKAKANEIINIDLRTDTKSANIHKPMPASNKDLLNKRNEQEFNRATVDPHAHPSSNLSSNKVSIADKKSASDELTRSENVDNVSLNQAKISSKTVENVSVLQARNNENNPASICISTNAKINVNKVTEEKPSNDSIVQPFESGMYTKTLKNENENERKSGDTPMPIEIDENLSLSVLAEAEIDLGKEREMDETTEPSVLKAVCSESLNKSSKLQAADKVEHLEKPAECLLKFSHLPPCETGVTPPADRNIITDLSKVRLVKISENLNQPHQSAETQLMEMDGKGTEVKDNAELQKATPVEINQSADTKPTEIVEKSDTEMIDTVDLGKTNLAKSIQIDKKSGTKIIETTDLSKATLVEISDNLSQAGQSAETQPIETEKKLNTKIIDTTDLSKAKALVVLIEPMKIDEKATEAIHTEDVGKITFVEISQSAETKLIKIDKKSDKEIINTADLTKGTLAKYNDNLSRPDQSAETQPIAINEKSDTEIIDTTHLNKETLVVLIQPVEICEKSTEVIDTADVGKNTVVEISQLAETKSIEIDEKSDIKIIDTAELDKGTLVKPKPDQSAETQPIAIDEKSDTEIIDTADLGKVTLAEISHNLSKPEQSAEKEIGEKSTREDGDISLSEVKNTLGSDKIPESQDAENKLPESLPALEEKCVYTDLKQVESNKVPETEVADVSNRSKEEHSSKVEKTTGKVVDNQNVDNKNLEKPTKKTPVVDLSGKSQIITKLARLAASAKNDEKNVQVQPQPLIPTQITARRPPAPYLSNNKRFGNNGPPGNPNFSGPPGNPNFGGPADNPYFGGPPGNPNFGGPQFEGMPLFRGPRFPPFRGPPQRGPFMRGPFPRGPPLRGCPPYGPGFRPPFGPGFPPRMHPMMGPPQSFDGGPFWPDQCDPSAAPYFEFGTEGNVNTSENLTNIPLVPYMNMPVAPNMPVNMPMEANMTAATSMPVTPNMPTATNMPPPMDMAVINSMPPPINMSVNIPTAGNIPNIPMSTNTKATTVGKKKPLSKKAKKAGNNIQVTVHKVLPTTPPGAQNKTVTNNVPVTINQLPATPPKATTAKCQCPGCKKKFSSHTLKLHLIFCPKLPQKEGIPLICPVCLQTFEKRPVLKQHMFMLHSKLFSNFNLILGVDFVKHKCKSCSEEFASKEEKESHEQTHIFLEAFNMVKADKHQEVTISAPPKLNKASTSTSSTNQNTKNISKEPAVTLAQKSEENMQKKLEQQKARLQMNLQYIKYIKATEEKEVRISRSVKPPAKSNALVSKAADKKPKQSTWEPFPATRKMIDIELKTTQISTSVTKQKDVEQKKSTVVTQKPTDPKKEKTLELFPGTRKATQLSSPGTKKKIIEQKQSPVVIHKIADSKKEKTWEPFKKLKNTIQQTKLLQSKGSPSRRHGEHSRRNSRSRSRSISPKQKSSRRRSPSFSPKHKRSYKRNLSRSKSPVCPRISRSKSPLHRKRLRKQSPSSSSTTRIQQSRIESLPKAKEKKSTARPVRSRSKQRNPSPPPSSSHLKLNPKNSAYRCTKCAVVFSTFREFTMHQGTHEMSDEEESYLDCPPPPPISYGDLGKSGSSYIDAYTCVVCLKSFKSLEAKDAHSCCGPF